MWGNVISLNPQTGPGFLVRKLSRNAYLEKIRHRQNGYGNSEVGRGSGSALRYCEA